MDLKNWQLQAGLQNVTNSVTKFGKASCLSASILWNPERSDTCPVWEFDQDHQRWIPVGELEDTDDEDDQVYVVQLAHNFGRAITGIRAREALDSIPAAFPVNHKLQPDRNTSKFHNNHSRIRPMPPRFKCNLSCLHYAQCVDVSNKFGMN